MDERLEDRLQQVLRTKGTATIRELAEAFSEVHVNTIRYTLRRLMEQRVVVEQRLGREYRYEVIVPAGSDPDISGPPIEQPPTPPIDERDRRKDELAADVDPIRRMANFMRSHARLAHSQRAMGQAREQLVHQDAREAFFSFFESLIAVTKDKSTEPRLKRAAVHALRDVSASIGVGRDVVAIPSRDDREIDNWQPSQLQDHIAERVSAGTFLFEVTRDRMAKDDGALKVGGSDVSQHWDIVHLPTADGLLPIRIAFPVVLHNAAVVIKLGRRHHERNLDQPWVTYFVPQLVQDAREWMVIDSATLYELDENLQKRLCLTSMDVGQYYIEHDQMMMGDFVPDVHFRDGRIFPNDCYGFNASLDTVQGKFVRKAIRRMDSFLDEAQKQKTMVCGVAKTTATGCFGPVVDWYIRSHVESDWPFEDPRPADTVWMTHLLSDGTFDGTFNRTLASCGVVRTFRDASDLRATETSGEKLKEREERLLLDLARHDFADTFKRVLDTKVAMFFIGHSRRPDIRLPRYEYHTSGQGSHADEVARVLAALKFVGLVADEDHDYLARETLRTLVPSVILYSHDHSKAVGDRLVLDVKQKIIEALRPLGSGD